MPGPLLIIGGVAAAVSLGMTAHSAWKQRKWKRIHDDRYSDLESVQKQAEAVYEEFAASGENLGHKRVQASNTLQEAAQYLRGVAKHYQMDSLPEIPDEDLEEWVALQSDLAKSLSLGIAGSTASGVTAAGGTILYTAAGLFGVASTGTRIAGLSGAAAHGARLAWIGGGALAAGGGGAALGSTVLNVLSKANVVTAPLALAAGFWSEKKAHDLEKTVIAKLQEFTEAEILLRRKITAMQNSIPRIDEFMTSIEETEQALLHLLQKARALPDPDLSVQEKELEKKAEPDLHLPHQVYLTAKTLRALIAEPAISEDIRRIIEE